MDERDILTPAIDGWSLSNTQSSDRARERFTSHFWGGRNYGSRLALHGWTGYHDTCNWWMISFQNTVKRESERELHSHTFCTTRFPLHEWMNEIMMTSAIDGWSLSKTQKRVIFTVDFWGMKVCTSRRPFHGWMKLWMDDLFVPGMKLVI
jgi:hypothetical protein